MHIHSNSLEVSEYIYKSKKLPSSFDKKRILHISDLHAKTFGGNNERLKNLIDSQHPDVVFFTGDVVDGDGDDYSHALDIMKYLSDRYKTFYIIGNHEQKALIKKHKEKYKDYFSKIYALDFTYLNNRSVLLNSNFDIVDSSSDDTMRIYGFIPPFSSYRYMFSKGEVTKINRDFITSRIGEVDRESFNVLMAHNALDFEHFSNWGADLIFSGHVHGGLIRLPIVGGILSPDRRFFPKYSYGRYDRKNSTMFVSKGLGGSKIGIRFRCKPEISIILLESGRVERV